MLNSHEPTFFQTVSLKLGEGGGFSPQDARRLQNGAHFCFRAAIVLRRAEFEGAMRLLGEVADGEWP
ncbi:hypothetical protein ABIG04_009955 [Bradyrhizobium japonicum]